MAKKFSVTIIALFCLFTLSLARTLPAENDEATANQVSFRVPNEAVKTETEFDSDAVTTVPLTKFTLHPVNRRFDVRSKRPCHHHFRVHPMMRRENEPIPYGNDMIISSGENSDFEDPVLNGEIRRIPGRWVRLHHHHHDEDSDGEDDDEEDRIMRKFKILKKIRKHFGHQNEEVEKKKKGGFMKRVRKFLDHHF